MQPQVTKPLTLDEWLFYLESLHPKNIELGLERVNAVYQKLALDFSQTQVVMVAGTNGKGTTCAMIEQGVLMAGKTTAVYSSPHILDYRERVRINEQMLSAEAHCAAFSAVDKARGDIPLTYFEFGTLAGLYLIAQQQVDVALLEVGLGGRLDAINVVDADLAVITTIDLDHQDWLGDTREKIALEKAGIMRTGGQAVIGDFDPPHTLQDKVQELGVKALWQGKEFKLHSSEDGFDWQGSKTFKALPQPAIPAQNMSTALAVLHWLQLEFTQQQLEELIHSVQVPGRYQLIQSEPDVILDVAHNPQAGHYLAQKLQQSQSNYGKLKFVVAMLADKDIEQTLLPFAEFNADWYLADLAMPRGAKGTDIQPLLASQQTTQLYDNVTQAFDAAIKDAQRGDLVVVFGSFYTVAEIMALYSSEGS